MNAIEDIFVPQEIANDDYVKIVHRAFSNGDLIKTGDCVGAVETSKMVVNVYAKEGGYIQYFCRVKDEVKIGALLARVYKNAADIPSTDAPPPVVSTGLEINASDGDSRFSKAALALMTQYRLNKNMFSDHDLVSAQDVLARIQGGKKEKVNLDSVDSSTSRKSRSLGRGKHETLRVNPERFDSAQNGSGHDEPIEPQVPPFDGGDSRRVDYIPISQSKRREIENLSSMKSSGLHCVVSVSVDTAGLKEFLSQNVDVFKDSLLVLAVAELKQLLGKFPELNAFYSNGKIGYYREICLGLAVNLNEEGLRVLKIPGVSGSAVADQGIQPRSLASPWRELDQNIFNAINRYLDGKMELTDVTGITFTLTDLSSQGVDFFVPLIPKDQSAILGIGAIDSNWNRARLILAFDHRVSDGKQAGMFLRELKLRIESVLKEQSLKKHEPAARRLVKNAQCAKCFRDIQEDKEIGGIGMIPFVDHDGQERFVCVSCFNSY